MKEVSRILFTNSWCGYSVGFVDGTTEAMGGELLLNRLQHKYGHGAGMAEFMRLSEIAHRFPCNVYKNVYPAIQDEPVDQRLQEYRSRVIEGEGM